MHGSFLTFDLSIKIEILHALLAVSMQRILLVCIPIPINYVEENGAWGGGGLRPLHLFYCRCMALTQGSCVGGFPRE